jgi:beta-galactosidase
MILATQYYRPPFPEKKYWKQDLYKIKESGLNAIQLWAIWAWIEMKPGQFYFEDYDELFDEAEKLGLGVIISSIAELHPLWIHRVIPDSHMIDHMGRKVISSNRHEANNGLTPGGCTDNPAVIEKMRIFLKTLAERYSNRSNLIGWDCWNENRWNNQADGIVCFCPHTIKSFRSWLLDRYGSLDGLNEAWKKRYCSWEDVMPGKLPGRPYSEMMEFEAFLQWRLAQHMKFRYDTIRSADPNHIITAHASQPSFLCSGDSENQALFRGNDFDLAAQLDGYGCSHFPFWFKISDEDFGIRVETTRSAANGKLTWVSELQGGSARQGFSVYPPVRAKPQQRWVWNGYGRGAKAVIFWCWRDEVFGKESSGFGLAGMDGYADERLDAMKKTGQLLNKYGSLFKAYKPDGEKVGVWFDPNTYNLEWAEYGLAENARDSITGYLNALERTQVPYKMIESSHIDQLDTLKLLIMPFPIIVPEKAAEKIIQFVRNGGTLLVEGETDAFTTTGIYRYPGEDRPFAYQLGIETYGRRPINEIQFELRFDNKEFQLYLQNDTREITIQNYKTHNIGGFYTPLKISKYTKELLSKGSDGSVLAVLNSIGSGKVLALSNFPGKRYSQNRYEEFEQFLKHMVNFSGVEMNIRVKSESMVQWRSGLAGNNRLLFVINPGKTQTICVRCKKELFNNSKLVYELSNDETVIASDLGSHMEFTALVDDGGYAVFKW